MQAALSLKLNPIHGIKWQLKISDSEHFEIISLGRDQCLSQVCLESPFKAGNLYQAFGNVTNLGNHACHEDYRG